MKIKVQHIIFWIILPTLNFFLFLYVGSNISKSKPCDEIDTLLLESLQELEFEQECETKQSKQCSPTVREAAHYEPYIHFEDTDENEKWRSERLADMNMEMMIKTYIKDVLTGVVRLGNKGEGITGADGTRPPKQECASTNQHLVANKPDACFAVAYVSSINHTYHVARVDQNINHYGVSISNPDKSQIDKYSKEFQLNEHNKGRFFPTGFFRKVPKERGRERTKDKLGVFLLNFKEIVQQFDAKFEKHGIKPGDDVVVMVVNEGEIDLFLNFACSCKLHHLSLNNVLIFSGSPEIVSFIEATGAMALYHEGYAAVSKKASVDYLDRVFVDMMWYKAFSIYLPLRKRVNVLFQDVDLVWFRNPMPYFHDWLEQNKARSDMSGSHVDVFFSDDGQRSMRYTPFYANSGFYYMFASERSEYFAWSIMIAMDAIQVRNEEDKERCSVVYSCPYITLQTWWTLPV